MVTHNFNKLLPHLFNMNTLVSDQSSPMTYTNRFCVAMLAVFATYNPSEAALTVLRSLVLHKGRTLKLLMVTIIVTLLYTMKKLIFFRRTFLLYSPCPYLEDIKDVLSYKVRRFTIGQNCCAVCTNVGARA